ncbi:MAPEG family protein [Luteimonas sp. SX5]|uniref:MAPEG family protein n=1 Tax=Luteimonas galliterrae TaxID=2940486 RepID=A0ABT0MGL9_9GAMM|nr:MAPEG family protein [Luteimonas galliterrae]MCL1634012.1 MAPEG family protein [Luteimonas galliterrae]
MSVQITSAYAGLLGLWLVALSVNVAAHRAKLGIGLGAGGDPRMRRVVRMHGNASESIPVALLLMALCEIGGGRAWILHAAGVVLVAARAANACGLWKSEGPHPLRVAGAHLTWLTTLALACLNIAGAL